MRPETRSGRYIVLLALTLRSSCTDAHKLGLGTSKRALFGEDESRPDSLDLAVRRALRSYF